MEIELLKAMGYPLTAVVVLVVALYIFRRTFEKCLESLLQEDIAEVKNRHDKELQKAQHEHNRKLQEAQQQHDRKLQESQQQHELALDSAKREFDAMLEKSRAQLNTNLEEGRAEVGRMLITQRGRFEEELERLKSAMSVDLEFYRLSARTRFEALMQLWESSESLIDSIDLEDDDSAKKSIEEIVIAITQLRKFSVFLSKRIESEVLSYFMRIIRALAGDREELIPEKVLEFWRGRRSKLDTFLPAFLKKIGFSKGKDSREELVLKAVAARDKLEFALRDEFGSEHIRKSNIYT